MVVRSGVEIPDFPTAIVRQAATHAYKRPFTRGYVTATRIGGFTDMGHCSMQRAGPEQTHQIENQLLLFRVQECPYSVASAMVRGMP